MEGSGETNAQISNENLLAIAKVAMEDITPKPPKKGRAPTPWKIKPSKSPSMMTRAQEKQEKRVTRSQASTATQHTALPMPLPKTNKKTRAGLHQSGPTAQSASKSARKAAQSQVSDAGPRANPESAEGTHPAAKEATRPTSQVTAVHPSPTVQAIENFLN
jgi:hypothetical protein